MMRIRSMIRHAFAALPLACMSVGVLSAQAGTPLPTRHPLVQVDLNSNEPYYVETFKEDIDRLQTGVNAFSPQRITLASKDKLNILLDTIDMMLFRQYCDQQGIKVSDSEVSSQLAQYKASLGPGATDAMVDASLRRNGVFTDIKTYVKQDLLFSAYLRAKKPDDVKAISQPSASDVLKAYDDMKFNLRRPMSYRFTMLVARTQGKSDAEKKSIGDAMRAIANKLKVDPSTFDDYIVRGAVDPAGAGYQTMMNLVIGKTADSKKQYPGLYDAIFGLKEGEVSDLIEDDLGYSIVRTGILLPEKDLGLDDPIEGLTTKAATANPTATVLALVINELQTSKYAELQKTTRDAVNAKLRKDATITLAVANLSGLLDPPEIETLKNLKSNGYNLVLQ
jgi:hypothetical protein